jgi:hypothetical protein
MADFIIKLLPAIASGLVTGLVLFYWQRQQKKRDEQKEREQKQRDELKEEVDEVNRDIGNATMELAYATSIAVESKKTNGEMKAARAAYKEAVQRRDELSFKLAKALDN